MSPTEAGLLNLISERKIMSVQSIEIAVNLQSCFWQLVEMFRELQFCEAKVMSGIIPVLACSGEAKGLVLGVLHVGVYKRGNNVTV
jgi:hypothetical protein